MTYSNKRRTVGLTDDPLRRKEEHGNPARWYTVRKFSTEKEARAWWNEMMEQGYTMDEDLGGWEFGYMFPTPKENTVTQ